MYIIAFDLDDVICSRESGYEHLGPDKYLFCKPNYDMINIINSLYDEGHEIKIYTARGMSQFNQDIDKINKELYSLTKQSLDKWGLKYHKLIFGKEHYDFLIDDKAINSNAFKSMEHIKEIFNDIRK